MATKKSVTAVDVKGKRALVRVDFNVPQDDSGNITDDTRIKAALPTIKHLVEQGARVILMSHLGRPKGEKNPKYTLAPVAQRLGELISAPVKFAPDCIGPEAEAAVASLGEGEVLLLENVRYYAEETKNDPAFARQLAAHGDVFVNDAFGTAHRAHASTAGVADSIDDCVVGFLIEKELKYLVGELENPAKPFVVIMGGKKVQDKIQVLTNLLSKADAILIGGAMAYPFLKVQGYEVGNSFLGGNEEEIEASLAEARKILDKVADGGSTRLVLPVDSRHTAEFKDGAETEVSPPFNEGGGIPPGRSGIDIGDRAIEQFCEEIARAGTVIWNGPMGVFEIDAFAVGTEAVAKALAGSDALSIIGGGDSVTAINKFGLGDQVSFMSTGGGASLELLEGKELPGIAALDDV